PPSGSVVSDRVFQLRDETIALRRSIDQCDAQLNELRNKGAAGSIQYHATIAAIAARLQAGTTRGNPVLLRQWSEAEQSLSEVNYSISRLNALETDLSANAATAAYLLQALRATFELAGAVDEDHQQLALIRDEVARGTVQIDRMSSQVTKGIQRQTTYLNTERQNLQILSLGIDRGELLQNSLASQPVVVANPSTLNFMPDTTPEYSGFPTLNDNSGDNPNDFIMPAPAASPVMPVKKSRMPSAKRSTRGASMAAVPNSSPGQLLVLVRFNQDNVDYQQQLYQAVSDALDRKPSANFTVVAVTPKAEDPAAIAPDTESAQRHADAVKTSLIQLGLQPSRISMSNISSQAAQSPEVHVYIR
ncbi:MAG TPA: hypothetical protein VHB73_06290, partial [Alphaproteobacteria bacterium]|nr:hypothetical protein [Alphaproteobacteria bacterium]